MVWSDGLNDYLGLVVHRIFKIAFQTFEQELNNKNQAYYKTTFPDVVFFC